MTDTDVRPVTLVGVTANGSRQRGVGIAVLFAVTSFLGATLLFMVQPLAAKLVLPSFGGSATVWSTSSLFFQVLLLLGYLYAHLSTKSLGAYWQPRAHLLVLALPLLALPVALPAGAAPDADTSPALWLLVVLALMVGLPFLVLSATGPVIQRWYSWSRGPRADDPYFLFAGSNLGSFVGLLSYPFLIEPAWTLTQQRLAWSWGLAAFLILMGACALSVRSPRRDPRAGVSATPLSRPTPSQVFGWGALAFLPSCLMLAVTTHISTDVAPIPLVWVLPLAVYLASFVAAFARTSRRPPERLTRLAVASAFLAGIVSLITVSLPIAVVVVLDVAVVALVGYAAHARLATTRPQPHLLTTFYLVISIGGALGGVVNGIVAPLLLNRVWEYGLTLAAVPLLMLAMVPRTSNWFTERYHPAFRTVMGLALTTVVMLALSVAIRTQSESGLLSTLVVVLAAGCAGWFVARAPVVLALTLLVGTSAIGIHAVTTSMLTDRTFYGSYRVVAEDGMHKLVHGTTVHGTQWRNGDGRRSPTAYYAQEGPLGQVMRQLAPRRTAIVGLGAGAIATYARAGDHYTFYEIDPVIARIAENPRFFSYLSDASARVDVVLGDGRLLLEDEPLAEFDMIVLDAFSSDSVPVHLLTREALSTYVSRLRPDGVLVVHISNRIFNLEPVVASGAAQVGFTSWSSRGGASDRPDWDESDWMVLAPDRNLAPSLGRAGWREVATELDSQAWTDDYASILPALM